MLPSLFPLPHTPCNSITFVSGSIEWMDVDRSYSSYDHSGGSSRSNTSRTDSRGSYPLERAAGMEESLDRSTTECAVPSVSHHIMRLIYSDQDGQRWSLRDFDIGKPLGKGRSSLRFGPLDSGGRDRGYPDSSDSPPCTSFTATLIQLTYQVILAKSTSLDLNRLSTHSYSF